MTDPAASPLLRSATAPSPRTLVEVLRTTAETVPESPAVDNGAEVLTYAEFWERASLLADELHALGVGRGDRVGVRIDSGTVDLYTAIAGVLVAGAAYVPVDVDDPAERARTVLGEAAVAAVVGDGLQVALRRPARELTEDERAFPTTEDDAWIIFTSGSTGTPKGVAVRHRNAAAFVDAEARWFLADAPLGPGDRVMAGLSVAFDASCEEMWLAWRHGACLVPAPRSLVKSGAELGGWLVANGITVVSTVPTLVSLWPTSALDRVRLLILGGEACPPEIGARLATPDREVWNTYGPTEATVVACGARLGPEGPVRIGLPLDGWDLAVVDAEGRPVPEGASGELIIGGVGLARYLDPAKDAEKYAAMPTLGWDRAYRSGDVVVNDPEGLLFTGRADDQVKIGGRRIELGELDSALLGLPGVVAAAAAIRKSAAGNTVLVGYVRVDDAFDSAAATQHLRATMPAALVPRLAQVDTIPTRTSGKVDRDALPWPLPADESATAHLGPGATWLAQIWRDLLGASPDGADADFFDLGGGSLTAAQLVARVREEVPELTVADVYEHPTLGDLATVLESLRGRDSRSNETVHPVPVGSQIALSVATVVARTVGGLRWLAWTGVGVLAARSAFDAAWLPDLSWAWVAVLWVLLVLPPGRILVAAALVRAVLLGVRPGTYRRGGATHVRVWFAERLADEVGATSLSSAALTTVYAKLLGCSVGRGVDLHTIPPVTGLLTLGAHCSLEPEVDVAGHWVDGGTFHLGRVTVGKNARVGTRSTLAGGASVGAGAEIAPGSAVFGPVPEGEYWSGAPAEAVGPARGPAVSTKARRSPAWMVAYAVTAPALAALPGLCVAVAALAWVAVAGFPDDLGSALLTAGIAVPLVTLAAGVLLAGAIIAVVRLQSHGLQPGTHPIHGSQAWRAWTVLRVLDEARSWLFPLYSSFLTPTWLRLLGAKIGDDVEASTVLMIPSLTTVNDGAFLADDTMLGMYELGGGWLRVERVKIGRRAFVGNSGMTAPGRKVPKGGLVAVLSAAPRRGTAKAGSSWLGSPPTQLRRSAGESDASRTFAPARRLRVLRALVETCRITAVWVSAWIGVLVVAALLLLLDRTSVGVTALVGGLVLAGAGLLAASVSTLAKWSLVGRVRAGGHPLWSGFVWRNELADAFVEVVAAPWFTRHVLATPLLNAWLRSLGARIGRGVWCESYWLPETDLVRLDAGSTVNRGCVVQTHLFHDRILSMDTVRFAAGATLGPHGVVLPAASLGRHATVGPVSLVMRGEGVPAKTRWIGNPIGPWVDAG
ncbi:Pls/PosA family non-ribosomal peptide synthetase [Aeromicrobium sp. Leaf350]|uniref:Pls/PosA family non-ribosomal peptide synthetase n=1 Tax=Aeromicrobium sp. Leaf350 TaxID=2876565 RepID=UPI001E407665|nr:Pls/PosA family non-ribosomal peptide synthetase [Aeromicrobium sp. Leaf350]